MAINSRSKGKRGELELARKLREHGYDGARRSQQFSGKDGTADCVGLPGVHVEVKRVEKLNLYDAMAQSKRDSIADSEKQGQVMLPAVFHRKNNCEWLVTMALDDWIKIYLEWEAGKIQGKKHMNIYISQTLHGKTAEAYIQERKEIIRQIRVEYGDDVNIVGSYVLNKWDIIDRAFFTPGWQKYDDCIKEHGECERRGVEIICD